MLVKYFYQQTILNSGWASTNCKAIVSEWWPYSHKLQDPSCTTRPQTKGTKNFGGVGIARNAVFFRSFVASKVRKGRSEKRGCAKDRLFKMSTKFAPRLRPRAIRKSTSLKTGMFGALLGVDLDKICTTPARESDSEVKIVQNWHVRSSFGSWARQNLHHACARERFGSQNP